MIRFGKIRNTLLTTAAAALGLAMLLSLPVNAEYVNDDANGVRYDNDQYCSVDYAYDYAKGGGGYTYVYLENSGDSIANVKSSSKNLIAQISSRSYDKYRERDYDSSPYDGEGNYVGYKYVTTETFGYSNQISFFAKKAGSYKVTFDVLKKDGTLRCTKTINVRTSYSYKSPFKSIKYAGKDLNAYDPYTGKTKGKFSVKMAKGYKLVGLEIGSPDGKGGTTYKKIKNNKTIKLVKKKAYTTGDDYFKYTYNELFPDTQIRISYINTKTKEEAFTYCYLYTINKK